MLFSSEKDEDSCLTFHYYCDGIFPTITIILDTEGRNLVDIPLIIGCNQQKEKFIQEPLIHLFLICQIRKNLN